MIWSTILLWHMVICLAAWACVRHGMMDGCRAARLEHVWFNGEKRRDAMGGRILRRGCRPTESQNESWERFCELFCEVSTGVKSPRGKKLDKTSSAPHFITLNPLTEAKKWIRHNYAAPFGAICYDNVPTFRSDFVWYFLLWSLIGVNDHSILSVCMHNHVEV